MLSFVASLLLSFCFSVLGGCLEGSCGDGTCCSSGNSDEYLCCPLSSAVCCPDQRHCCPQGAECSPVGGGCVNKKIGLVPPAGGSQIADVVQVNAEAEAAVEKLVEEERAGLITKEEEAVEEELVEEVKEEKLEEELVKEVKEEKLEEEVVKEVKEETLLKDVVGELIPEFNEGVLSENGEGLLIGDKTGIVKCSDTFYCPSGNTCCFRRNGDYGCCPFINGVCCPDGKHCCPNGSRCDALSQFCISPMVQTPWLQRTQKLK